MIYLNKQGVGCYVINPLYRMRYQVTLASLIPRLDFLTLEYEYEYAGRA